MNLLVILGSLLLVPVVFSRLLFLARGRAGWAMYLANVAWESIEKKLGARRLGMEAAAAAVGLSSLWAGGISFGVVAALAALLLALELANRLWERRMLTAAYAGLDPIGLGPRSAGRTPSLAEGRPAPSTHPELTLNIVAPFVERSPRYRLGLLLAGAPFDIELIVGNHTRVPTQAPVKVELRTPTGWECEGASCAAVGPIRPGTVERVRWTLRPRGETDGGDVEMCVRWGHLCRRIRMGYDGCRCPGDLRIERAEIRRYPGGRRSAFAWRGDMDLYDTSTFQSIEGLEAALGLAARYCVPQTLCLSTRLSVDEAAAREWAEHYGIDRGAAEIPRFIQWLRETVEWRLSCPYPVVSGKRYVLELGNHGHLHYGTDTSAAAENGWTPGARMGAGRYPWVGEDGSSFGEQRDNALEARRWCERLLGFAPRSWAKPGRCNDADTPRAMEAAGCEVLSGSDIRARDNVLFQPPPHHPSGTEAVELTSRYPGDPRHVCHVAMLLFWLHRSHRRGIPMIYMCHQHMRQFDGPACTRFTEYMLRYVLSRFQGDFHVDTLYGVGKYWREVLSPKTRRVAVTTTATGLVVENRSDTDFHDLPVDVTAAGGQRFTVLVTVAAKTLVSREWSSG